MNKNINYLSRGVVFVSSVLILAWLVYNILEIIYLKPLQPIINIYFNFSEQSGIFDPLFKILKNYFFYSALIIFLTGVILKPLKDKDKDVDAFAIFILFKLMAIFIALAILSISMLFISMPLNDLNNLTDILMFWFLILLWILMVISFGGLIPYFLYCLLMRPTELIKK